MTDDRPKAARASRCQAETLRERCLPVARRRTAGRRMSRVSAPLDADGRTSGLEHNACPHISAAARFSPYHRDMFYPTPGCLNTRTQSGVLSISLEAPVRPRMTKKPAKNRNTQTDRDRRSPTRPRYRRPALKERRASGEVPDKRHDNLQKRKSAAPSVPT